MSNLIRRTEITVNVAHQKYKDEAHITSHRDGQRSICGLYVIPFEDIPKTKRVSIDAADCRACREEYLRRVKNLIADLTCGQPPVTDFATDFEIDAQEAEERGLRWAPVILWALADILREFEK